MAVGLVERTWFRRLFLLAAVVLVLVVVLLFRYPWSAAAIRESFPDRTWPAGGEFVDGGRAAAEPPQRVRTVKPTDDFIGMFEASGGRAQIVMREGEVVNSIFGFRDDPTTKLNSFSMVKSLVGVLTLQALSDGLIPSLDSTAGELWPRLEGTELAPVTVGELMDMRSGIAFEKDPGQVGDAETAKADTLDQISPFGSMARLHVEGVDAVVGEARLIEADRGVFSYQNLNTSILARILEEVHGRPIDQILTDEIVDPAGAGQFHWRLHPSTNGQVSAYCCLYATAEWWAHVARFISVNGVMPDGDGVESDSLLDDDWFDYLMGRDLDPVDLVDGVYRSQIRYDFLDRDGETLSGPFLYFAGLNGQITYIVPDHDLIVVRLGDRYQLLHSTLYEAHRSSRLLAAPERSSD